jgi:Rrf2 family protein
MPNAVGVKLYTGQTKRRSSRKDTPTMNSAASSMQLTRGADYAIRIMIHLAGLPENERVLLPTLAAAANAPASFLSKVLQALTRADLIASRRGQQGGFEILARGRQATILEVVEAIDGPIRLNVCLEHGAGCGRKNWCVAHPVWQQAQDAMVAVLRTSTVTELAGKAATGAVEK